MADIPAEQLKGMIYAIEQGLRLKHKMSWIARAFKSGSSITRISDVLIKKGLVNGSRRTVMSSVTYSLKGYGGEISLSPIGEYSGLMEPKEYEGAWKQHNKETSVAWNREMQERGIGLAGMTLEQRRETGRKSGLKQLEGRIGIHAQTPEERRIAQKLGLIAQGKTPWENEEMQYCFELSQKLKYQKGKTRVDWIAISEEVNGKYHHGSSVRDNRSVAKASKRYEQNIQNMGDRL